MPITLVLTPFLGYVENPAMSNTYSPLELVALPRVDIEGAIALASALESAALSFSPLPDGVAASVAVVAEQRTAAQKVLSARSLKSGIKEIDTLEDLGISVLVHVTKELARFKDLIPEGQSAHELDQRLFQDGLDYVNYKVEQEWAIVDTKLKTITDENLEPKFAMIGLTPILSFLKQTHAKYGDVIGVTKPSEESPEIGKARRAVADSIRFHVIRVMASVEPGKPETEARAAAMLKPIEDCRVNASAPAKPNPPAPPAMPPTG